MHHMKTCLAAAACALAIVASASRAQNGWTDLTAPAGAQVFYVAANGSDSNAGTQAAPFKTVQRGFSALRDGQPDQVRLRCGDTWNFTGAMGVNKGCTTAGRYLVVGSYGTGPRPKIVTTSNGLRGESAGRRGIAFVGIEIAGNNVIDTYAITMLGWRDILIEDCYIHGFRDNIIIQGYNTRSSGIRIRRNVIADAYFPPNTFNGNGDPTNKAQGIYMDLTDDWVIEENVFDRCGIVGSMFGRPVYVQSDCSRGTFVGNIMARSPAEGVQVRPGGTVQNNLSLRNPIGIFVGDAVAGTSEVSNNVVIESGDINTTDRRGIGIHVNGSVNVHHNVLGYNTGTGWGTVFGLYLNGANGDCNDNYVWDWTRDPAWGGPGDIQEGLGINFNGAGPFAFNRNKVFQVRKGIVCERDNGAGFNGSQNTFYWNPTSAVLAFRPFTTMSGWASTALPANPRFRVEDITGRTLDQWMMEARQQSRQYWRAEYTAASFNATVRSRVGMGGGPPTCYANCDGSTVSPVLNALDYQCFLNSFASGSVYANCDGSTGTPRLTPNDFLCYMNHYVTGCP